jgi:hypothetical protein
MVYEPSVWGPDGDGVMACPVRSSVDVTTASLTGAPAPSTTVIVAVANTAVHTDPGSLVQPATTLKASRLSLADVRVTCVVMALPGDSFIAT